MVTRQIGKTDSAGRRHLAKHIKKNWPSQSEFARQAGLTQSTLNYILRGAQAPNLKTAVAIELLSESRDDPVRPREWLEA